MAVATKPVRQGTVFRLLLVRRCVYRRIFKVLRELQLVDPGNSWVLVVDSN